MSKLKIYAKHLDIGDIYLNGMGDRCMVRRVTPVEVIGNGISKTIEVVAYPLCIPNSVIEGKTFKEVYRYDEKVEFISSVYA